MRPRPRLLARVLEWAHLHQVGSLDEGGVATWGDSPVPIAGDGAPLVSEFCIYELAPALGLSAEGGRYLLAHALELHHRLPRLWARVQGGTLQAWKARRVADKTITLSPEAAHQQVSFTGTSLIQGELDLVDALDLEKALQTGAEQLKALGSEESLDVRRSVALGQLARGDQFLPDVEPVLEKRPGSEATDGKTPSHSPRHTRRIVLHLHLSQAALGEPFGIARVESPNLLLIAEQVARWCGLPETEVIVKPVIDLNQHLSVTSYEIPDRMI